MAVGASLLIERARQGLSATRAKEGGRNQLPTLLTQTVLLAPPPRRGPRPPPSLARLATADPALAALMLDGATGWRSLAAGAPSKALARAWTDTGVLDVAAGADPTSALEAAAAACTAAGISADPLPVSSLAGLFPGARLVLPRRGAALWCATGGGLLDAVAADALATATASAAGVTVWSDWALAGWQDARGGHWRLRERGEEGRVAEAERVLLASPAAAAAFGVRYGPGVALSVSAPWVSLPREAPLGSGVAIFCHGLADAAGDDGSGASTRWVVVPTDSGVGVCVPPPDAVPGGDDQPPAAEAAAALAAAGAALPNLSAASAASTRATTVCVTADGAPVLGWAPPALAETGRVLLLALACGGAARVAGDGLAAAPLLADTAASLLTGATVKAVSAASVDPGRSVLGGVSVEAGGIDTWEEGVVFV